MTQSNFLSTTSLVWSLALHLLFCFSQENLYGGRKYKEIHTHTYTRAAIEKEPFTLEKDKEDQSKYYLRYQKPSVLDMKWENHDINVVEWANFKVLCSTKWRLGENVILRLMECFAPTVKFDIFITISHLFVSRPTLEFRTFEQ